MSDIDIARKSPMLPIEEVAAKLEISPDYLHPYGKHIAKLPLKLTSEKEKQGHLVLRGSTT